MSSKKSKKQSSRQGNNNVVRFRRRHRFNIGLLIFGIIFVYLTIIVVRYFRSDTIRIYEVQAGTMSTTSTYTGLCLRDETVCTASDSGYLSYYAPDCSRVSAGSLIYTVDETGRMIDLLEEVGDAASALSDEAVDDIRDELSDFSSEYDPSFFSQTYSLSSRIRQSIGTGLSEEALAQVVAAADEGSLNFTQCYAERAGIITFRTDGFEDHTAEQVTASDFDTSRYAQTVYSAGDLVESTSAVGKIITSEQWDIVIPISGDDAVALNGNRIVSVTFKDTGITVNAEYSTVIGSDGEVYAKLHLYKYMIRYANRRYVDLILNIPGPSGLKIPVSSVVTRDLFTIPEEYLLTVTQTDDEGNTSESQVIRVQRYDDEGNVSTTDISTTVYLQANGLYYIGMNDIHAGDVIQNADASSTYTVYATQPVQGVYNVNRGYAVFRRIEILDQNDEYCIISDSTPYGVSIYDHIILNAVPSNEGEVLYE